MPKRNYIIYTDESDKRGRYFSNFFGGVILKASEQQEISARLIEKKNEVGLRNELKWQFVDQSNFERYSEFIRYYFDFIKTSRLRARIMFTQNMRVPIGLEKRHHDQRYFILYYQFLKHAFGIAYCNPNVLDRVYFSILPDKIPDSPQNIELFKDYISRIQSSRLMRNKNIFIPRDQISDVDSRKHVILQGLDLILGSMCARLNDKLYEKPEGQRIRGKRTRAKESLYKCINKEIREIYPNFNVGVGTGCANGLSDRWTHPYRHWLFMPSTYQLDRDLGKKRPQ